MKEEGKHCCLWVTWGQKEWGVRRRRSPEETETDRETRDKRGRDQMHRWKALHSFLSFVLIYFSSSFGFSSWRTTNCSPLIQEVYTESEEHTVDKQSCKSVDNNDMRSLWERTLLFSGNEKKKLLKNENEGQGSLLCLIKSQAGICWKATRDERLQSWQLQEMSREWSRYKKTSRVSIQLSILLLPSLPCPACKWGMEWSFSFKCPLLTGRQEY